MPGQKRRRNADGSYTKSGYRKGSYPYAVAAKYRKRAVAAHGARGSAGSVDFWGPRWDMADPLQQERRALMHYRGDGDYRNVLKWGSRGLGALAGGVLGGYGSKSVGGALRGGQSGWDAGAGFSKYMGWGDYAGTGPGGIVKNQIIAGGAAGQRNISVNRSDLSGDVIYEHTEFIQNIVIDYDGSTARSPFTNQVFALNPGLEGSFPFLAQLAANFTMYEMEGLIFHYKPTTGEGGTNALGKVLMATDYDPSALPFTNSQAMENYDYASSSKPSLAMHHGVETALRQRLTNQLYIRTEASPAGPSPVGVKDKVLTDLGLFQVATEGVPLPTGAGAGSQVIGELWVTYKVKLSRASLRVNQELALANFDYYMISWTSAGAVPTAYKMPESSIGGRLITPAGTTTTSLRFEFPENVVAGTYRINLFHSNPGAGLAAISSINMLHGTFQPIGQTTVVPKSALTGADEPEFFQERSSSGRVTTMIVQILAPDNAKALWTIVFTSSTAASCIGLLSIEQLNSDMKQPMKWGAGDQEVLPTA